ncbi:hypothetical protein NC661_03145 [Aquibacillus koreensis]|uniref:Uncharacterized protein n=1 Tax=Aquibacillus koreensis TaxID=279446 RepID=A0A9X3WLJ0_9BACI|nr:hypothetical protein [Aquibacillus koreensis]MCT2536556.1 hypothetical protein [Aquibacillus koreensis]MDC3419356.1 hypothetical protein [Aquibacillus koreensis]
MKKAVGYIKVRKDITNSLLNKLVIEGMKEICEQKNWELIDVYQDKVTQNASPKKASRRLLQEMKDGKSSAEVTIIFCYGKYVIYGPDEIDFVFMEDMEIGEAVAKELFIHNIMNA